MYHCTIKIYISILLVFFGCWRLSSIVNVYCFGAGHGLFIIKMSYSDGVISEPEHLYALSLDPDSCEWQRWQRWPPIPSLEPRSGPGPESSRKLVLLQQTWFLPLYISITITLVTLVSPAPACCSSVTQCYDDGLGLGMVVCCDVIVMTR